MPLTTLDPIPAVIVVDLQEGVKRSGPEFAAVVGHATELTHAFRSAKFPVVLVNVAGGAPGRTDVSAARTSRARRERPNGWTKILPELGSEPDDILITKQRWGAFSDTSLDKQLRSRGVTLVVICGVATSIGVESTARSAHELGYHVVLATDAMFDSSTESHLNSISRIFPRLGETATTHSVLDTLAQRGSNV